ncbi:MAG: PhnD/SsuA/transferrin family substrate-binding protein [Myxococcota bacterium]
MGRNHERPHFPGRSNASTAEAEGFDTKGEPSAVEAEGVDTKGEPSAVEAEGFDTKGEPSGRSEAQDPTRSEQPPEPFAALPMYDLPELRSAHDALWRGLATTLAEAGMEVPRELTRRPDLDLAAPGLILGQTCGYPLLKTLQGKVRVVGRPAYTTPYADAGWYVGLVVVPERLATAGLGELRRSRAVVNDFQSHSGMNALRAIVARVAGGAPFFETVHASGSHRESMRLLRRGDADVASIDSVTWTLLRAVAPDESEGLTVIARSAPAPTLPFVTDRNASDSQVRILRDALETALARSEPTSLLLTGLLEANESDYEPLLQDENDAAELGYPELR